MTPDPVAYPAAVPEGSPLQEDADMQAPPYMERPGGTGQPQLNPARTVLHGLRGLGGLLRRQPPQPAMPFDSPFREKRPGDDGPGGR